MSRVQSACFFFAILLLGLLPAVPSFACSRPGTPTEEDNVGKVRYVFHALVIRTELLNLRVPPGKDLPWSDGADRRFLVNATYELKTSIKDPVPRTGRVTTPLAGGCTFPLVAGCEYIFFVEDWPAAFPGEAEAMSLGMISSTPSASEIVFDGPSLDEQIKRLRSYGNR